MKSAISTMFFILLNGQLAFAQSAGGGGGGDRPSLMLKVSANRPIQMNTDMSTCRQLNTALQLFGKLRLNSQGVEKPVFKVVFTELTIPACNPRDITPYRTRTLGNTTCQVGFTCEPSSAGR